LGRSEFDVAKTVFGLESGGVLIIDEPRPAAKGDPAEDASSYIDQVEIAVSMRDFDRARTVAETGLGSHPHSAELHMLLAKVFRAQSDYTKAEDYCRRALRLDSMLTNSHRLMGDVMALQGRFTEAVEWWERWLRIQDGSPEPDPDIGGVRSAVQAAQLLHNQLRASHG
jgi:tetratricopeptide (TPR) repeat protein